MPRLLPASWSTALSADTGRDGSLVAACGLAGILGGVAGLAVTTHLLGTNSYPAMMAVAATQLLATACLAIWALRRHLSSHALSHPAIRGQSLLSRQGLAADIARHLGQSPDGDGQAALILCQAKIPAAASGTSEDIANTEDMVGALIAAKLPPGAMAAQWSHDTVLIFLPTAPDPMPVLALARDIVNGQSLETSGDVPALRCGIALAPADGSKLTDLLHCAELALAEATRQGRPGYGFFSPDLATVSKRRLALQRAVAEAVSNNALRLVFQPIYQARSGELSGFEALVRLDDPELGAIAPTEFIPIAEETGAIAAIGQWTIDEACRHAAQWPPHLVVAINLSPQQFLSGNLVGALRRTLEQHGLPAYRVEFEITEGTLMTDSELVLSQLRMLRDMGAGVALDDFGTGFSSLSYLCQFPFSKLKIDRSFTAALDDSPTAKPLLRAIVRLGHGLGMTVTAEGIETAAQLTLFRSMRCDLAQGYLLGRPSPATDLAAIILRNFAQGLGKAPRAKGRNAA